MVNINIIDVILSIQFEDGLNIHTWKTIAKSIVGVDQVVELNDNIFHIHISPRNVFELISIVNELIAPTEFSKGPKILINKLVKDSK